MNKRLTSEKIIFKVDLERQLKRYSVWTWYQDDGYEVKHFSKFDDAKKYAHKRLRRMSSQ